jgi:hypothetical protein
VTFKIKEISERPHRRNVATRNRISTSLGKPILSTSDCRLLSYDRNSITARSTTSTYRFTHTYTDKVEHKHKHNHKHKHPNPPPQKTYQNLDRLRSLPDEEISVRARHRQGVSSMCGLGYRLFARWVGESFDVDVDRFEEWVRPVGLQQQR